MEDDAAVHLKVLRNFPLKGGNFPPVEAITWEPCLMIPRRKQMLPEPDIHHGSSCGVAARLETADRYKAPPERVMELFLHDTGG